MKTVPEMLREAAATYEERNKLYRDNYLHFGIVMRGFFHRSVTLETVEDFNRMGVLVQVVSKISRYCENFEKGGHDDSLLDMAVYSQMLRELDAFAKNGAVDPFLASLQKAADLAKAAPEDQEAIRRHAKAEIPTEAEEGYRSDVPFKGARL